MRIVFSWLKEFLDLPIKADDLARGLTERGIEAETVLRFAHLRDGHDFGKVLYKVRDDEAGSIYAVLSEKGELELASRAREIPENLTVLVNLDGGRIPTLDELGISSVRFPLVKPSAMGDEELFSDAVIDFGVVSNRGDLLSHFGIAREARVAFGGELRMPAVFEDARGDGIDKPSIRLENVELCPRYVGAYLNVTEIGPSPDFILYRLSLCGATPICNIVDLSNYVLFELGQPLHTFDRAILEGAIVVRNARKGEKFTAINHVQYELDDWMLLIADEKKGLAIAGVMGGLQSEIRDVTRSILLESAYFTPTNIRVECKNLGLISESSLRFGRGTDPEMPPFAGKRFIHLAQGIGAGELVPGSFVDANSYTADTPPIRFSSKFVNSFLGVNYSEELVVESLKKLGIAIERTGEECVAIPPSWRGDLETKEDIAEEILRVNLFDSVPARELLVPLKRGYVDDAISFEEQVEDILVSLGAQEMSSTIFVGEERLEPYNVDRTRIVAIENPDTSDQAFLLPTLLPPLISAVSRNLSYLETPQLLFEVGRTYSTSPFETGEAYRIGVNEKAFHEQRVLGVMFGEGFGTPALLAESLVHQHPFYVLKGVLNHILKKLGTTSPILEPNSIPFFSANLSFQIDLTVGGERSAIGFLGEVDSSVTSAENVDCTLAYMEISLDALRRHVRHSLAIQALSQFPPVIRDIALIAPATLETRELQEVITAECGDILASASVFDVYQGKQVPAGKKSIAFRLRFQSPDRTLTGAEVDELLLKTLKALHSKLGIALRDFDKVLGAKVFAEERFVRELSELYKG